MPDTVKLCQCRSFQTTGVITLRIVLLNVQNSCTAHDYELSTEHAVFGTHHSCCSFGTDAFGLYNTLRISERLWLWYISNGKMETSAWLNWWAETAESGHFSLSLMKQQFETGISWIIGLGWIGWIYLQCDSSIAVLVIVVDCSIL